MFSGTELVGLACALQKATSSISDPIYFNPSLSNELFLCFRKGSGVLRLMSCWNVCIVSPYCRWPVLITCRNSSRMRLLWLTETWFTAVTGIYMRTKTGCESVRHEYPLRIIHGSTYLVPFVPFSPMFRLISADKSHFMRFKALW